MCIRDRILYRLPCSNFIYFCPFLPRSVLTWRQDSYSSLWHCVSGLVPRSLRRPESTLTGSFRYSSSALVLSTVYLALVAFSLVLCNWPAGNRRQNTSSSVASLHCVISATYPANFDVLVHLHLFSLFMFISTMTIICSLLLPPMTATFRASTSSPTNCLSDFFWAVRLSRSFYLERILWLHLAETSIFLLVGRQMAKMTNLAHPET